MSRAVEEWVATHDDQAVPPRVKARIFAAYDGRCYLSKRKIAAGEPWQVEHIIALCNGGEHRERNMAPVLAAPHRMKTDADLKLKAKITRQQQKHLGIYPRPQGNNRLQGRGFPKRGGGSATPHSGGSGRFLNENKGSDQ